ncbi:hypothetical protein [Luteimicrobium subarcticum]|uniref:Universal stress protein family protein n=1 Tax=Luteimicrobium subarcticum TaxID=620910 RepID=A0A2M8W426_9MICO|nr:hypothetical protein [Luteimicrobium subarcticum]PJI85677.1 hypothetical protein CLV34_2867 [Luteimicrobium subarcticum]
MTEQPTTVLVLAEDTLNPADVAHILDLHPDEQLAYEVLVPADSERNFAVELIDHLSVGELREAWRDLRREAPSEQDAERTAQDRAAASAAEIAAAGRAATTLVTDDDPLPALADRARAGDVREVVVVTYPHALEDTFHRDWASRARDELELPVLHLYSGTSELG